MVLFLPAEKHLQVFNSGKYQDNKGTNRTENKHTLKDSYQHRDDLQTHKHTMLFETRAVDQCGVEDVEVRTDDQGMLHARGPGKQLCYADVCDESLPVPGF